jgi:hypothetical protein
LWDSRAAWSWDFRDWEVNTIDGDDINWGVKLSTHDILRPDWLLGSAVPWDSTLVVNADERSEIAAHNWNVSSGDRAVDLSNWSVAVADSALTKGPLEWS